MWILAASLQTAGVVIAAMVLTAMAAGTFMWRRKKTRLRNQLAALRSGWATPHDRERDFVMLAEFHQACPPLWNDANLPIDNHTWNDLNGNDIHGQIDRTLTTAGECLLYRMLRAPVASIESFESRNELVRLFDDSTLREKVQLALVSIGRQNARGVISLIWHGAPQPYAYAWLFYVLTLAAFVTLPIALIAGGPLWVLPMGVFAINMSVHSRVRTQLMGRLNALRQLGALINAARKIARLNHPDLNSRGIPLQDAVNATSRIARKVWALLPEGSSSGDLVATFLEYISIFFLHEVRTFHSVLVDLASRQQALRLIFRTVGELDALQAVASFRAGANGHCEPQFAEDGPRLAIRDARHPLLAEPVANSIEIASSGIAITGSNMSGKTTFLKTVAVNALLAQSIGTCLASSYRARFLQITSSMNEQDSLLEGKSYYLAEAERLLAIVRQSEGPHPVLALIDEPLAGTNSPERLAASREILRFLVQHGALVMVSTHDVEMVTQLKAQGQFQAFHFADQADDKGIRFDYRLRSGMDYHGNAIQVLKYLGYPDSIVDNARASLAAPPEPAAQGSA